MGYIHFLTPASLPEQYSSVTSGGIPLKNADKVLNNTPANAVSGLS